MKCESKIQKSFVLVNEMRMENYGRAKDDGNGGLDSCGALNE
jgi:hypothetical protein